MHFVWLSSTFLRVLKFLQIKEGGPNFCREPILHKIWIIWSPLPYLNFKSFLDANSSSFIIFQWNLHDSGGLFSESSKFYKSKRGDLTFRGNQFWSVWIISSPFCISILKVLWTQIHCPWLDLKAFWMIEEYFSQSLEISTS